MLFDIYLSVYFHFVLFGTRKAKMNEVQKTFEERLLKQTKILKLKTFRSWHLFKQKAGKAWKEFDHLPRPMQLSVYTPKRPTLKLTIKLF